VTSSTAPNYVYKLRFNISDFRRAGPGVDAKLTVDQYVNYELHERLLTNGIVGTTYGINN